jgi:hypothetical protein
LTIIQLKKIVSFGLVNRFQGKVKRRGRPDASSLKMTVEIRRPLVDDRAYRHVLLPNKLSVLLIHDPTCDKASAALDVHVGTSSVSCGILTVARKSVGSAALARSRALFGAHALHGHRKGVT